MNGVLVEQCSQWNQNHIYSKIPGILHMLDDDEKIEVLREACLSMNNVSSPEDMRQVEKFITQLLELKEPFPDEAVFNLTIGSGYLALEKPFDALDYLLKIQSTKYSIDGHLSQLTLVQCKNKVKAPFILAHNFRDRSELVWQNFIAKDYKFRKLLDKGQYGKATDITQDILSYAIKGIRVELCQNEQRNEIVLPLYGNTLDVLALNYLKQAVPSKLEDKWDIQIGRPALGSSSLMVDGIEISHDDISITLTKHKDQHCYKLKAYSPKLNELESDNRQVILQSLVKSLLGEIVCFKYLSDMSCSEKPLSKSFLLSELPNALTRRHCDLELNVQQYLDSLDQSYTQEPSDNLPEETLRSDIVMGCTKLPQLNSDWLNQDYSCLKQLSNYMMSAGFFSFL